MARRPKKTEKYITERISRAGTRSYEICIRAYGQTYRKSVKISDFDSPSQAMAFAKKLRDQKLVEMESGYTVSQFQTVEDLFKKTFTLLPVRQKTVTRHEHFYNKAIAPYGKMSIDKITSADIQESINQYALTHTREQTGHLLAVWRRIYKTAVMMNISIPDRTVPVTIPECMPDNPRKKEISQSDLKHYLEILLDYNKDSIKGAYQSRCIYYAIQIMRYCGLRPSECFALTRDDIFLTGLGTGCISISKSARSTVSSSLEISGTKTKKSNRLVPIPEKLAPILKDCLQWSKYNLLFADYNGNLQSIDDISDYVRHVAKKAGVQFNLYMLRHQLSTDLFSNGIAPNVIRDIMGHESASMSLEYAVSNEADRKKAMDARIFS